MKFFCRNASITDLDSIVDLHYTNFDSKELSSILGKRFIRSFYRLCITSGPEVSVKVIKSDTGHIAAVSMVFFRYTHFEKVFKKRAILPFLISITNNILKFQWKELWFLLNNISARNFHSYVGNNDIYDHYIGSLIIGKENKTNPPVIIAAYKMFSENVKRLKDHCSEGVWASVRISNKPSLKMMFDQGLKDVIQVPVITEDVLICIYRKPKNERND